MPFTFTCPYCFKKTLVEDRYAGQTGPCVGCSKVVTLPNPREVVAADNRSTRLDLHRADSEQALHHANMDVRQPNQPNPAVVNRFNSPSITRKWLKAGVYVLGITVLSIIGWGIFRLSSSSSLVQQWQERHDRMLSLNNLTKVARALNAYAANNGSYPPAVVFDENGKPMHSWRVLILKELGEANLYNQYNFNEPWDSEHNLELLTQCPAVYRSPAISRGPSFAESNLFVITGNNAIFSGNTSLSTSQITDGATNTLLVVEAGNAMQGWTMPIDVSASGAGQIKLGGIYPSGFAAATASGEPVWIPADTSPELLRALISANGGEAVDASHYKH